MLVVFNANDAVLNQPAGTVRKTCIHCKGLGQCTWIAKRTFERTVMRCTDCNGVGCKFVKDTTPSFPLALRPPPSPPPSPPESEAVEETVQAHFSASVAEATPAVAAPASPVLASTTTLNGQVEPPRFCTGEPWRQEEAHVAAKARSRPVSRSGTPELIFQRMQAAMCVATSSSIDTQEKENEEDDAELHFLSCRGGLVNQQHSSTGGNFPTLPIRPVPRRDRTPTPPASPDVHMETGAEGAEGAEEAEEPDIVGVNYKIPNEFDRYGMLTCGCCGRYWDGNAQCPCTPPSSPSAEPGDDYIDVTALTELLESGDEEGKSEPPAKRTKTVARKPVAEVLEASLTADEELLKTCRICDRSFYGESYNHGSCINCMDKGGLSWSAWQSRAQSLK